MPLYHFQPAANDVDQNGQLRKSVLSDWFEQVQGKYLATLKNQTASAKMRWSPISLHLDYFSECQGEGEVSIEVAVSELRRSSLLLGCRIVQGKRLCVVGHSELECRDPVYGNPMPISESVQKVFENEILDFQRINYSPLNAAV
ncbi:hypothetical protein IB286_07725 [Spongiibacter sp. KMU-158]|uniref:Uncharacterized protein n=1 Tax=Spongiibacter pelagi TaxID=2760804 RepID=A0A927C0B7_9GAMM|nr:thioesterase family protein [Spongiibacter pelagi]MBD2858900.1 hypothetical protein [Spongiibacter pelagi]